MKAKQTNNDFLEAPRSSVSRQSRIDEIKSLATHQSAQIKDSVIAKLGELKQLKKSQNEENKEIQSSGSSTNPSSNFQQPFIRCKQVGCLDKQYRREQCKHHFIAGIMKVLRKVIRDLYRSNDKAYAALDFSGIGYVTEETFLQSLIIKRMPFTQEELKDFMFQTNIFAGTGIGQHVGGMNYETFKKTFFPHLFQMVDNSQNDEQIDVGKKGTKNLSNNAQQQENIQIRLQCLEKMIKEKFSVFESVRKAFLGLDADYDGFITVEDILRHFGQGSKEFNFNDLKKLINEKDSTGQGRLNYADFSKWVGNSIHMSEGFYFRHDSIKNPQYEASHNSLNYRTNEKCKEEATKQMMMNNKTLERTVLDKIKFQWKTIKKAFSDMNKERDSAISPEELRFYLQHWGLNLTDEQFLYIFNKLDCDGDGMISYPDFHKSVGNEIHPGETLYFRQDTPHMMSKNKCQHPKCWLHTNTLSGNFCSLHNKLYLDQGIIYFQKLFLQIGQARWPAFIKDVKAQAEADEDYKQIFFTKFTSLLENQYGINMTSAEKLLLSNTYPGRNEGDKVRINISKLYEVKQNNRLNKVYKGFRMSEIDSEDQTGDKSGYIGIFYREPLIIDKSLAPFTLIDLANMFAAMPLKQKNQTLAQIMLTINQIDKEHNGYVTSTELEDILKISLPLLANRQLKPIFKDFQSIQNKILIDYKRFRDGLLALIKSIQEDQQLQLITQENALKLKKDKIAERLQNLRDSRAKQNSIRQSQDISSMHTAALIDDKQQNISSSVDKWASYLKNASPVTLIDQQARMNKLSIKSKKPQVPSTRSSYLQRQLTKSKEYQCQIPPEAIEISQRAQSAIKLSNFNTVSNSVMQSRYLNVNMDDKFVRKSIGDPYYTIEGQKKSGRSILQSLREIGLRSSTELNTQKLDDDFNMSNKIYQSYDTSPKPDLQKRAGSTLINASRELTLSGNKQEQIKRKLQSEWKNIYRTLSHYDIEQKGVTSMRQFDKVVQKHGVNISKEELKLIGGQQQMINFAQLSKELGLHSQNINIMKATHNKINRLKAETRYPKDVASALCYSTNYLNMFKINNLTS